MAVASGHSIAATSEIYWSLQELVRIYQFRDKDRVCRYGLTVSECYALECLVRGGPTGLNNLAKLLYSDKSTVSRIVANLEAKGYSQREGDQADGRAIRLFPTARGKRLHTQIVRDIVAEQQKVLADLPAAVRRGLPLALRRLAASAASRCQATVVEVGGGKK